MQLIESFFMLFLQGTVFYENTMNSDTSFNQKQYNRKSIISSQSTGSSNNEVRSPLKKKAFASIHLNNSNIGPHYRWFLCHHRQIKTVKYLTHRRSICNQCWVISVLRSAAIRTFSIKLKSRNLISVWFIKSFCLLNKFQEYTCNCFSFFFTHRSLWYGLYVPIICNTTAITNQRHQFTKFRGPFRSTECHFCTTTGQRSFRPWHPYANYSRK